MGFIFSDDNQCLLNFRVMGANALMNLEHRARLYRSGTLINVNKKTSQYLKDLGIKVNIDLRSQIEINKYGFPQALINENIEWLHFPMQDYDTEFNKILIPTEDDYKKYYQKLLETNSETLVKIFTEISNKSEGGIVFNCFSGKDRTGVISYLLLNILGVNMTDIYHDYELSSLFLLKKADFFKINWQKRGLTKQQYLIRLSPSYRYIESLHHYIVNYYGGVKEFFINKGLLINKIDKIMSYFGKNYR